MWKNDKLLILLKEDSRFKPIIVSFLYPKDSDNCKRHYDKELSSHFNNLGVEFISGFDYSKNKQYPVSIFKPDIIFYPQPYINNLKHIPFNVLLAYIPYGFPIENSAIFHNTLFQNICWKYFIALETHKAQKVKYNYNHGVNMVVSGDPLSDYFFDGHTPSSDSWPISEPQIKRVIWAPHHSIRPQDWLDYSCFLEIADGMLEIAKKFTDTVQFVFKPHPMLKEKLYKLDTWGIEKTNAYYNSWNTLPNCKTAEGNYVDLFMTSDAMIHDCSAFTAEYLYVNKPVMYLTKKEKMESFNDLAQECFNVHYHGASLQDIESFIQNVIKGYDPLKEERTKLIRNKLVLNRKQTVAETIYYELCKLFE